MGQEAKQRLRDLMAAGNVKSIIGSKFPSLQRRFIDAHELSELENNHALGKISSLLLIKAVYGHEKIVDKSYFF